MNQEDKEIQELFRLRDKGAGKLETAYTLVRTRELEKLERDAGIGRAAKPLLFLSPAAFLWVAGWSLWAVGFAALAVLATAIGLYGNVRWY